MVLKVLDLLLLGKPPVCGDSEVRGAAKDTTDLEEERCWLRHIFSQLPGETSLDSCQSGVLFGFHL